MSAPHVALVGLPGVGKSTLAGKLAAELEMVAVDLDDVVERRAGRTIAEIFERDGEAAFRDLESEALAATVEAADASVIACGGGVVLAERNRRLLSERTRCVWLAAAPPTLVARLASEAGSRPLLSTDVAADLEQLAAVREPLYREVADVVVDVTGRSEDEALDALLTALR